MGRAPGNLVTSPEPNSANRSFDGLNFAQLHFGLLQGLTLGKDLKSVVQVPRTQELKQATPLELRIILHLESWISSEFEAVSHVSAMASGSIGGLVRMIHVVRSHPSSPPSVDGLFCTAFRGKAKDAGAAAPMPWAMPASGVSGAAIAQPVYDRLSSLGLATGELACLLPGVQLKRGATLPEATGFTSAPMTLPQFLRHLKALCGQAPGNLSAEDLARISTYSLRRVMTSWMMIRGLEAEKCVAAGDWASNPADPKHRLTAGEMMAYRYSAFRQATALSIKNENVLSLQHACQDLEDLGLEILWDNVRQYVAGRLDRKPPGWILGPNVTKAPPGLPGPSGPAKAPLLSLRDAPKGRASAPKPKSSSSSSSGDSDSSSSASEAAQEEENPLPGSTEDELQCPPGLTVWAASLPWFASRRGKMHWTRAAGPLQKDIAAGLGDCRRAVQGCGVRVLKEHLAHEDKGIHTANASPRPWCPNCKLQVLRAHPEATADDLFKN